MKVTKETSVATKLQKAVKRIYDEEKKFIEDIFKKLPQSAQEKLSVTPVEDQYIIANENNPKKIKFLEETKAKKAKLAAENESQEDGQNSNKKSRASLSHEELQRRLHAKIALLGKERIENGQSKKAVRRKLKKAEKEKAKAEGKKKLISQKFSSTPASKATSSSETGATNGTGTEKTPLQTKPVKNTNGELVFSKFDFISEDNKSTQEVVFGQKHKKSDKSSKPDEILKSIEKSKSKVERLEKQGKTSEAVSIVDKQKWNNALQRAKGTKVRDDPTLLKKTIKKQDKIKKDKQKKWAERVDNQEKQMKQRQTKRLENIQAKKSEKVKKSKKLLRKKGRIA